MSTRLLNVLLRDGFEELVTTLFIGTDIEDQMDAMETMVLKNNTEILQYLLDHPRLWGDAIQMEPDTVFLEAVKQRRIEMVKMLLPYVNQETIHTAIQQPHPPKEIVHTLLPYITLTEDRIDALAEAFSIEKVVSMIVLAEIPFTDSIMDTLVFQYETLAPVFQHEIPDVGDWMFEMSTGQLKEYLQYGGDPNVQDEEGNTLLHIFALSSLDKRIVQIKLLLDAGANPNIKDGEGNTPLHMIGDWIVVQLLLMTGADPTIRNKYGGVALTL